MTSSPVFPPDDLGSTYMRDLVDRVRLGDGSASNELLSRARARLEGLAQHMLGRYPTVNRFEEAADVVQGASLRLLRALEQVRPQCMREFYGLAAEQIRRELIDLARSLCGKQGWAANLESNGECADSSVAVVGIRTEPIDEAESLDELELWTAFHVAVARLPAEEREVFNLRYYHGWKEQNIADLLKMEIRTVRRKWRHACLQLNAVMRQLR
jgi:RNA polymerase sigma-70 factor (ECF subfamily)